MVWHIVLGRLPTPVALDRRRIKVPTKRCLIRREEDETEEHFSDFMARSSAGSGGGRGCGGGRGRGGGRGSTDTVGQSQLDASHRENSDYDESVVHVATVRRGSSSQPQVPEQMDRDWIFVEYGQFSKQVKATHVILSNLKSMWSGPWQGWGDVPKEDRDRLFERFQCYFQWEKKWNAQIHSCWEKCIAGKFANMLSRARNGAIAMARKKGLQVGDDTSVLHDFKPAWMRIEPWKELCEIWNTPKWKEKRRRNKENRNKSTGGKHTLGSQTFVTANLEAAKKLGREPEFFEMWRQSRCKKGRRPLDKAQECTNNVVEGLDSEENGQEQNQGINGEEDIEEPNRDSVDERSFETWKIYKGYLVEKYGSDESEHPKFDQDLWTRAGGGLNKGKLYGFSNVSDPLALITGTPSMSSSNTTPQDSEIQKLNGVIEDLVKEKEEDKQRLNGVIDELTKEKEDKQKLNAVIEDLVKEKEAVHDRMTSFESLLQLVSRNILPPS